MLFRSKIHFKNGDDYIERPTLSIILSGKRTPHIWDKSNFDINFYDLKGILENILSASLNKKFKFKTDVIPCRYNWNHRVLERLEDGISDD